MEENLEQLIIGSSFDELSPADRERVLSYMTEADYNACHTVLPKIMLHFTRAHDTLSLSPEIIQHLQDNFRDNRKKRFALYALFDPINFNFSGYKFRLPGYRLILLAAVILLIWTPIKLSHRIKSEPGTPQAKSIEQVYATPDNNDPTLSDVTSAPKNSDPKISGQMNTRTYSTTHSSDVSDDRRTSEKYLCYYITIPHDRDKKNPDIRGNSNSPGFHANLLIPDSNPINTQANEPDSPD